MLPMPAGLDCADRDFEYHLGDSTIWLISTPILRDSTPSLFPCYQDNERTCDSRVPSCRKSTIHLQKAMPSPEFGGRGSLVVVVSDRGQLVSSLNPVALKTHNVGERCMFNLSRA
ncbi:hypothetical protein TNCV_1665841 [Trichonephila clavipes]|nr:hypothetical protein TNCV_1665841 [Trichonephila clavipes]